MGHHPRAPIDYGQSYWAEYQRRDMTDAGAALTRARLDLVLRHFGRRPDDLIDIGIGGGRFVQEYGAYGFDVNQEAIAWLNSRGAMRDPYKEPAPALAFWDSLEHIPECEEIVATAREWVFVSMPIYQNMHDCLASPHYKPGEHLWYWTLDGLNEWFMRQGFELMELNHMETELGRRGIMSFAFKRVER